MANTSFVCGFSPVETLQGNPYNGKVRAFVTSTGDSTAIFIGDLVNLTTGCAVVTVDSQFKGYTLPLVNQSAASTVTAVGVVVGFEAANVNNPTLLYRVGSTQRVVYVCDDPFMIHEAQEDGDTTPIALNDMTGNINIIVGAGNTTTGLSGMQLDSSTVLDTSTLPLKLIRPVARIDNDASGALAFTKYHVMLNNCAMKAGTAGLVT
jgi:hypothetical protein